MADEQGANGDDNNGGTPNTGEQGGNGGAGEAAAGAGQQTAGGPQQLGLTVHTQYVKDLSFENPNAPRIYIDMKQAPEVSVNLDVQATRLQENTYEVVLVCEVTAKIEDSTAFIVELKYGGLISLSENVADEQREGLLLIEAPRYLFPFARNVISDCSRDGGFPPLLINPVDFTRLYREQKARQSQAQQQPQDGGQA